MTEEQGQPPAPADGDEKDPVDSPVAGDPGISGESAATRPGALVRLVDRCCKYAYGRVLTLLLLGAACALTGLYIGRVIASGFDARETVAVFKGVTLAAVAFSLWKVFADNFVALYQFISSNNRQHRSGIARPLSQLAVAVTGFGLVLGTDTAESRVSGVIMIASNVIVSPESAEIPPDRRRIMLPFFSGRPTLPQGELVEHDCKDYQDALTTLDAAGDATIETLACGLGACSTSQEQVEIDVRGFASSKPFTCGKKASDDRNLDVAEARRREVIDKLKTAAATSKRCTSDAPRGAIRIARERDRRWGSFQEMEKARDLIDLKAGSLDTHPLREILTRRVDVVIMNPGNCKLPGEELLAAQSPE